MTTAFLYMEDCQPGQIFTAGPLAVTADDIIAFATQYDPQTFHVDAQGAKHTTFGELVASGWHTSAMTMRLLIESMPAMEGGMIGRRIESLDWPRPVKPGDCLSVISEIKSLRATSQPGRGLMRLYTETRNQNGEAVLKMDALIFIPRKEILSA